MSIKDIVQSQENQAIFNTILEEACRQWCDNIENAPERKDGEGFAEFFYEIFEDKKDEYIEQLNETVE